MYAKCKWRSEWLRHPMLSHHSRVLVGGSECDCPRVEAMHLQQVAMDARDGFRFVRAARQVDRRAEGSSFLGRSGV